MNYFFHSPLGAISYAWDGKTCQHIWLNKQSCISHGDDVSEWLSAYFEGATTPPPRLAPPSTNFQGKLRIALLATHRGNTMTYGELSKKLHTSPRGLGQALGANHFPILIPCHRIVAAHSMGGYAYGSSWKERILTFEKT